MFCLHSARQFNIDHSSHGRVIMIVWRRVIERKQLLIAAIDAAIHSLSTN